MTTVAINKPEGIYYLLNEWRDNYESGTLLDKDSIYEKNGLINKENAEKGLKWVATLNNIFNNLSREERLAELEKENIFKSIQKVMDMVGINTNPAILKTALLNVTPDANGISYTDPIMLLLPSLHVIFNGVTEGQVDMEITKDGEEKRKDLLNIFGGVYSSIASMMADVTEDAIESSVRQNGKSYYSHITPAYLGKMIKDLKAVHGDMARFGDYIKSEFKDFSWFYKDGKWRNDWLQQLESDPDARKNLNHKMLLDSDGVQYKDWDSLDYTLVMLNEYLSGDVETKSKEKNYAWYPVPVLSDAPSAEFIRFRKYKTGNFMDTEGKEISYKTVLLAKLTDLVSQEYDRIKLVMERDRLL